MRAIELESEIARILREEAPVLRTVGIYAGELDGAEASELAVRTPAAFVAWGGSEYHWADSSTWREDAEVAVLIAARGASEGAGAARQAAETVFNLLAGRKLHPEAEALRPVRASLVFTNRMLTLCALEFRIALDRAGA